MFCAKALAALVPLLALPTNAYFILSQKMLTVTRLDPIVDPGVAGGHVHAISGGNNFDKTMSYASAKASTCTTAQVSVDKSNYWTPQLYYYNPADQTYQAIPADYMNAYYLPRGGKNDTVKAFPDGLRMIAGNPNRRTFDSASFADRAVSYVCLDYTTSHAGDPDWAQRNNFFTHNCPTGLRAQVNFPSCWDGVNLDSADHMSHMAYASGGPDGGGDCPSTHPVHLVTLFYEFVYPVQKFPFNNASFPTYSWSNGDTTGYGFHGDFLNGWPSLVNGTNVLQQAIDGCNANNGVGGNLQDCPPFVPYLDANSAYSCKPANPILDEDIGMGHTIKQLPGNNPLWVGNGVKPSYANYTETATTYTDGKSKIPAGYSYTGCISEVNGRALTGASYANANVTRGSCVAFCQSQGYPLAGIEYGRECYCDFQLRNGASNTTLLAESKCGMSCANNTNENCGGSSTLSLFNNPALYPVSSLPDGWASSGCQTEVGGRAIRGYSFTSNAMTPALCMNTCKSKGYTIAGAEYSSECYCGNSFTSGSAPAAAGDCKMACSGDKFSICGGPSRLTTWTYTAPAAAAPAAAPASNNSTTAAAQSNNTSTSNSTAAAAPAAQNQSTSTSNSTAAAAPAAQKQNSDDSAKVAAPAAQNNTTTTSNAAPAAQGNSTSNSTTASTNSTASRPYKRSRVMVIDTSA